MAPPKLTMRSASDLVPYARNARTHSEQKISMIAGSIREFGFRNPVLVDGDNGIIAGHARVQAALKLGLAKVPCVDCSDMSETQRRAYILADNRLALNAGWDQELLALELTDLSELDVDLEALGFSEIELNQALSDAGAQEGEDECPEIQDQTISERNDVWMLGRHRLMCGDSTSADDVKRLLDGVAPPLMVTDPPYGVEYDSTWRDRTGLTRSKQIAVGLVKNDDQADWGKAWQLFFGDVAYIWHASCDPSAHLSLLDAGFEIRSQIIWAKQGFVFGRGHYHWQHEPCWYAVRKGKAGGWVGDRAQATLWHIDNANLMKGGSRDDITSGHGTQKPVECMRRPILNNSSPGQAVYEPFSGSGTTIIAAETTGRSCYAMEISPAYVDMAVRRWQDFTGEQAMRQDDGASFDDCTLRAA